MYHYYGWFAALIILLVWSWTGWRSHHEYLYGFWTADGGAFCETTDIDSMLLFVGHPGDDGSRTSYLIISPDICNQGLELSLRGSPWCLSDTYTWHAHVVFDETPIWPEYVDIIVSKSDGTLRVVDADGVLYASLNKQNDITNVARVAVDDDADDIQ